MPLSPRVQYLPVPPCAPPAAELRSGAVPQAGPHPAEGVPHITYIIRACLFLPSKSTHVAASSKVLLLFF